MRYFGVKSTNVLLAADGTKPAKSVNRYYFICVECRVVKPYPPPRAVRNWPELELPSETHSRVVCVTPHIPMHLYTLSHGTLESVALFSELSGSQSEAGDICHRVKSSLNRPKADGGSLPRSAGTYLRESTAKAVPEPSLTKSGFGWLTFTPVATMSFVTIFASAARVGSLSMLFAF